MGQWAGSVLGETGETVPTASGAAARAWAGSKARQLTLRATATRLVTGGRKRAGAAASGCQKPGNRSPPFCCQRALRVSNKKASCGCQRHWRVCRRSLLSSGWSLPLQCSFKPSPNCQWSGLLVAMAGLGLVVRQGESRPPLTQSGPVVPKVDRQIDTSEWQHGN